MNMSALGKILAVFGAAGLATVVSVQVGALAGILLFSACALAGIVINGVAGGRAFYDPVFFGEALKPTYEKAALTGLGWPPNTKVIVSVMYEPNLGPTGGVSLGRTLGEPITNATGRFDLTEMFNPDVPGPQKAQRVFDPVFIANAGHLTRTLKLPLPPLM